MKNLLHFILVEGVNFDAHIYDTDQLSIIRGGSSLYKAAIDETRDKFFQELEAISTGASSGLFKVKIKTDTPIDGRAIADKIINYLKVDSAFQHLTILVEYCAASNVLEAKRKLYAQLRWRQLQTLSQAPDNLAQADTKPSELEGTRIAALHVKKTIQTRRGETRQLSQSELVRWQAGRQQKSCYYATIAPALAEKLKHYRFCSDIEALCCDSTYSKLNGKMAVIYIDGNGFGKLQETYLQVAIDKGETGIEAQQTFDKTIQHQRNQFLETILNKMLDGELPDAITSTTELPEEGGTTHPSIRLETLLWGGDEMLFVLPAWLGMEFLQQFFIHSQTWILPKPDDLTPHSPTGQPLTHAAGIVFCKAKTPIRIIKDIAKNLADRVKDQYSREKNAWDYLVLESVDYPTEDDLTHYFATRYPQLAAFRLAGCPVSDQQPWSITQQLLQELLSQEGLLPTRQLYKIVSLFNDNQPTGSLKWSALFPENATSLTHPNVTSSPTLKTKQEQAESRLLQLLSHEQRLILKLRLPQLTQALFGLSMTTQTFDLPNQSPCVLSDAQNRAWAWVHLLELSDYLVPAKRQVKVSGA